MESAVLFGRFQSAPVDLVLVQKVVDVLLHPLLKGRGSRQDPQVFWKNKDIERTGDGLFTF